MAYPQYADEAVVILSFVDKAQSSLFPSRVIRLSRTRDKVMIGRTSNRNEHYRAQLDNAFIDSAVMSREHALLQLDVPERKVYLVDVGSTHGTCANGEKVSGHRKHHVRDGDNLQFGIAIQHGPVSWPPCKVKADVIFGRKDPAQRPAIFVVPDDSDVEAPATSTSSSQDASVLGSCKSLWANAIKGDGQAPARQRKAVIDLTSNDKTSRAQQTDHALFPSYNTPVRPDREVADEDFPESRIPTPPQTDDRQTQEEADMLRAVLSEAEAELELEDEDEDPYLEQALADDDDAFDGDDDDFDDNDLFDDESRFDEDELDAIDDDETRSRITSLDGSDESEQDPNASPSDPAPPVLEVAVSELSLAEDRRDDDDVPMTAEDRYRTIRPPAPFCPGTDAGSSPWASVSIRQRSPIRTRPVPAWRRYSIGIRVAGSRRSPERVERDLIGLERDESDLAPLDEMDIEVSGPASGLRLESSAFQRELSQRLEAKKAAWLRVSDDLVRTRLQSPPAALAESVNRPAKRKVAEMSRDDEPAGSKERVMSAQPLADASPMAVEKDVTSPDAADDAGERAPKRLRKMAEALGYATIGGIVVVSALIATAPSL